MGNRQDSQQKSGENDSFPEELSLSRLSGRPTIWRYYLVRPVLSGEACTVWGVRYYLLKPVPSREAGTVWWGRYYLMRPVLSVEADTIWWGRYYLMRPVISGEASTIWWGQYFLVRLILSGEAGTFWWGRYYLVRPVLSGEPGTICIALSDNEYSILIQAYWMEKITHALNCFENNSNCFGFIELRPTTYK